jgi:gamma-polyglutamate synthase
MIVVASILLTVALSLLAIEFGLILKYRKNIPVRIHVNGTRGKSSVTRYVTAGLRAAGYATAGKITGIIPTIINPDGSEEIIYRRGPANIREQIQFLRRAYKQSCTALVVECMSIAPELQNIETKIFQPTVTVLTNIYDDHREELGQSEEERISAYCASLPSSAAIITGDDKHYPAIRDVAISKSSSIALVSRHHEKIMNGINPDIIDQNVALAVEVCAALKIDETVALNAIKLEAMKQPSHIYEVRIGEYSVPFVNGFAVNDIPSAQVFLEGWEQKLGWNKQLIFIINTRKDRPYRSREFARWCATLNRLSAVMVAGTHIPFTTRALRKYGIAPERIHELHIDKIRGIEQAFQHYCGPNTAIFGFGNIAGDGFRIVSKFSELIS